LNTHNSTFTNTKNSDDRSNQTVFRASAVEEVMILNIFVSFLVLKFNF